MTVRANSTASAGSTTAGSKTVLWVAIVASFVSFLDGSIVNVALPAIADELGGGLITQQWVLDAYLLTLGSLILLAGSLSDTFGRLRVLQVGLVLFGLASVACALAPSDTALIVARGSQGVAAALLVPSSLALITSTFSAAAQARAIGTWTGWTGTAFLIGPVLGGSLVDLLSWRWIFAINVLPIAAALLLILRLQEPARRSARPPLDFVGAVLAAAGLAGPVFALIEHGRYGWGAPLVVVPLVVGIVSLGAFLLWERRTRHPMMPLGLLRRRNFAVGNLATAAVYGGLSLGGFAIAVFLQQTAGFSAAAAGAATVPTALISLLLSTRVGSLAGRYGPRLFMAVGPIIGGAGFLVMLTAREPFNFWLQVLPGILLFGVGLAITVAPLTAAILGSIGSEQSGIASAVNNAVSRVAGLVGIAAIAAVVGPATDFEAFHRLALATAVLLIAGGVVSGVGITNSAAIQEEL